MYVKCISISNSNRTITKRNFHLHKSHTMAAPKLKAWTENTTWLLCVITVGDQPFNHIRLFHVTNKLGNIYLVDIMNELVHLPVPCVSVLVPEICPHGPHNMIGASDVGLKRKKCTRRICWYFWPK